MGLAVLLTEEFYRRSAARRRPLKGVQSRGQRRTARYKADDRASNAFVPFLSHARVDLDCAKKRCHDTHTGLIVCPREIIYCLSLLAPGSRIAFACPSSRISVKLRGAEGRLIIRPGSFLSHSIPISSLARLASSSSILLPKDTWLEAYS